MPKTAKPASDDNQPNRQFSSEYVDRKHQSVIATATTRSGYNHSKPLEAAVETMPAAIRTTKGIKYGVAGLCVAVWTGVSVRGSALNQARRREKTAKLNAT